MVICEVCVEGLSGALAATAGGAQRIELCAGLIEGGTTPSLGTVQLAIERAALDVVAMVRPRGGDFLYSEVEFETMLRDVESFRTAGAYGIATGILNPDGTIDTHRMGEIVSAARPMAVTCHRAFDMTSDYRQALESLIDLGVDRVLTSGLKSSVPEGLDTIRELIKSADGRITVMPGCGINEENIREIVESTGAREVHFTAFQTLDSEMKYRNPEPFLGGARVPGEYELQVTDAGRVRSFIKAII